MKIDCYISESCSSGTELRENIQQALGLESAVAEVKYHRINDAEAERLGIKGSPTVFIDGKDILPGDIPGIA